MVKVLDDDADLEVWKAVYHLREVFFAPNTGRLIGTMLVLPQYLF